MELYNEPKNLFVAGFIGSPAMNFMPATLDGDRLKLPMAEVAVFGEVGGASGEVIAGIRPEDFEDAALVGENKNRGATFKATIDVLESMGSELYAHFSVATDQAIESEELRELAEDSGAGEVPSAGEEGEIVARLEAASKAQEGSELELWVDATKVKLFDPKDGRNLAVG
jgi:multiple sugar transport system ATP-binding protein